MMTYFSQECGRVDAALRAQLLAAGLSPVEPAPSLAPAPAVSPD